MSHDESQPLETSQTEPFRKTDFAQFEHFAKKGAVPGASVSSAQLLKNAKQALRNGSPPPTEPQYCDDFEKIAIIGGLNHQASEIEQAMKSCSPLQPNPSPNAQRDVNPNASKQQAGKSPCGRKAALDQAARNQFCMMLRVGLPRYLAALQCGVHASTITRTMKRDQAFRKQVLDAEAQFEVTPLLTVLQAARKNWQAAKWVLHNYQPHASVRNRKQKVKSRENAKACQGFMDEFEKSGKSRG